MTSLHLFTGRQSRLPRSDLRTSIAIAAPPSVVWPLIADPAAHLMWNPALQRMQGSFRAGERFTMTLALDGGHRMTLRPRVLSRQEGHHITWRGRVLLPGLMDGTHSLRVEPDGQGGSHFFNEESFSGLLLRWINPESFRSGFDRANEGLRRLAEAQTR